MHKKLSVIIPVYNVEKYVGKCIVSVLSNIKIKEQIEIIIVDDKSSDGSMLIVSDYENQYKDIIKIIRHPVNKGLGGARNTGIDNANGEFICFLDSDDWYAEGAVSAILNQLKEMSPDEILIFGFSAIKNGELSWKYIPEKKKSIDATSALYQFSLDKITPSVCNKVFPKKLIENSRFSEHRYYEDLEFTPRIFDKAKKISFYDHSLYNYRQDGSSITRQQTKEKHINDLSSVLISLSSNLKDEKVSNNFFFNRWSYLLRIWNLDKNLLQLCLKLIIVHSKNFDLGNCETAEYEKLKNKLKELSETYKEDPVIERLYAEAISLLSERVDSFQLLTGTPQTSIQNKNKPLFSIIIPVYNGGKFIKKALDSFKRQKFKEFEVIYVDDQSTDNSFRLIENYQKENDFIKLYKLKTNSGAGIARNFGVEKANGDYIIFNDSDDWLHNNALQEIAEHLNENQFPDLAIFTFSIFDQYYNYLWSNTQIEKFEKKIYTGKELFNEFIKGSLNPSPWNKVFKKSVWLKNKISFPGEIHHQDLACIPYACFKTSKATILQKRLYNYYSNKEGVSMTASDKHVYSPFKAIEILYNNIIINEGKEAGKMWKASLIKLAFLNFAYNFKIRKHLFNDEQVVHYISNFNKFCIDNKIEPHYLLNSTSTYELISAFIEEKLRRGINLTINCYEGDSSFEKLFQHYLIINNQYHLLLNRANEIEVSLTAIKAPVAEVTKDPNQIVDVSKQLLDAEQRFIQENSELRILIEKGENSIKELEEQSKKLLKRNHTLIMEKQQSFEENRKLERDIESHLDSIDKDRRRFMKENMELIAQNKQYQSIISALENEKTRYSQTYDHLPKWLLKTSGVFKNLFQKKQN